MAESMKVVEEDPKVGKKRAKSGVAFPYFDLDSCIEVAKVMHERAGGVCDLAQLAALLKYTGVRNGSFRIRISGTRMFGLIEETAEAEKIRVSERGLAIVAPVSDAQSLRARADAFLSVELFKKVFDQYAGVSLPEEAGLRNLLQTKYQVVPERIIPTVRIMLDSAEQAGFFKTAGNRSRMVMPILGTATATPQAAQPAVPAQNDDSGRSSPFSRGGGNGGGGGSGSDDLAGIDPAIIGLLRRLPPGGSTMTTKRRTALIEAFTNVVKFIYPDADEPA